MNWRTLGTPPLVHRKLCRDEEEIGPCFYCGGFIHKGDRCVMVVTLHHEAPSAMGICLACAQQIGEAVPKETDSGDGGGDGGGDPSGL